MEDDQDTGANTESAGGDADDSGDAGNSTERANAGDGSTPTVESGLFEDPGRFEEPGDLEDPAASDSGVVDAAEGDGTGLFDELLSGAPIFDQKEVLRPSYTPHQLPHRNEQINDIATILVSALRGDTPSNILVYGKTGTGKTASARFVSQELKQTSEDYPVPCEVEYINCEVTDTQYRVLARLANQFIEDNRRRLETELETLEALLASGSPEDLAEHGYESRQGVRERIQELEEYRESQEAVPMTGWPTDRVYSEFFEAVDFYQRVVVIMLDEIDKLVEKSGDDTLYNLSRMNSDLENSRVSIIGISNDLKFTEFLDPRVKSSLGEEEIVFPPYDAEQLTDILRQRADIAFKDGVLSEEVIPLCSAFAAQEHGDARRALDLLRTAGELAERSQDELVLEHHVREAQEKIELDRIVEAVRTLPQQSKLILLSIIRLEEGGEENINTGEVFNVYKRICEDVDADVLTQRRVTDLISELDMLGIVNAVVVSKGRYGRTKEISLSVPMEETKAVLTSDSRLADYEDS
jgi:cell division control protein 6